MEKNVRNTSVKIRKFTRKAIIKDFKINKYAYLLAIPGIIYFLLFNYLPMFGLYLSFLDYKPILGILGSEFVGLQNFKEFFGSIFAWRVIRNTLILSLLQLAIEFPTTIIFALLLNEIRRKIFKRTVQTVSYMPYFISLVIVAGIIIEFCSSNGPITQLVSKFTGNSTGLLSVKKYWRPIYIISNLWQGLGFGSIVYVAALTSIDQTLYEAAVIDGANRWKQTWHVTLPGIMTTVSVMLILSVGNLMSQGQEKTILLYNSGIYETADIISSYIYRKGLQDFDYGYSSAVGLFNSVINMILLVTANQISKKHMEISLF